FIIGSGRSGNTLLRRLLMERANIYIPPETYVLGRVINQFRQLRFMAWRDLVRNSLSLLDYHAEFETFSIDSLRGLSLELNDLPKAERSLAVVLNRFYLYCARANGRAPVVWGD